MQKIGIVDLYCGASGRKGFYNSQEIGMAKGYASFKYDCYIFLADGKDSVEEEKITEYVTIIHCPGKKIGVHGMFDWNIIKRYNLNYIQCNFDNQIFAPNIVDFCDKHDIPVFLYIGTIKSDSKNGIKKCLMNFLSRRNIHCMREHKCFVKTKAVAKELEEIGVKSEIVPVGLDIDCIPEIKENKERLRKSLNLPKDKKILLFVGRIDYYKKPFDFLKLVKDVDDSYHAVMIGSGKLNNELQDLINEYRLNNKVTWIKSIPNQDIHAYYKISDYFINFNDHEIFGMSILEAMYQGLTVIAVSAPGPEFIIRNKKNGYLVKNANEIKKLLDLNVKCDEKYPRSSVLNNFCWARTIEKIIQYINTLDSRG